MSNLPATKAASKQIKNLAMAGLSPSEIAMVTGYDQAEIVEKFKPELVALYELQGKAMEGLDAMMDIVVEKLENGEMPNRDGFNVIRLVAETTPAFRNVQAGVQIVLDPNNPKHRELVAQTLKR